MNFLMLIFLTLQRKFSEDSADLGILGMSLYKKLLMTKS